MYFFSYSKHFLVQNSPWLSIARRTGKVWNQELGAGREQTPSSSSSVGPGGPARGLWGLLSRKSLAEVQEEE